MSKGFASNYRIVLLAGSLLLCFGLVGARLVWLHVIHREELLSSIVKTRQQLIVDPSRRGDIFDARGARLATSRSVLQLGVDPQSLRKEDEKKWPQLAALIGKSETELRRIFTTKFRTASSAMLGAAPSPGTAPTAAVTGLVFNLKGATAGTSGPALPAAAESWRWRLTSLLIPLMRLPARRLLFLRPPASPTTRSMPGTRTQTAVGRFNGLKLRMKFRSPLMTR